jgi:amino acid adenylation domain-containing protein
MQEMMFAAALTDRSRYVSALLFHIKPAPFSELSKRFEILTNRFEILKTHFTVNDGTPFMIVSDKPSAQIVEVQKLPEGEFIIDPLKDEKLINIYVCGERLLFVFSHILLDGWSTALIMNELFSDTVLTGKTSPFRYFCKWLDKQNKNEKIAPEIPQASLPFENETNNYERKTLAFELEKTPLINKTAAMLGMPIGRFIEALWGVLCARYGGGETLIAAVDSGRFAPVPGITSMAGMLIQTITVPVKITENQTFADFARQFSDNALSLIKNGTPPYEKKLKSIISVEPDKLSKGDNFSLISSNAKLITDFDFVVVLGEKINCRFEYNGYSENAVNLIKSHFQNLLDAILSNPNADISGIDILSDFEKSFIFRENTDSEISLLSEIPIPRKFKTAAVYFCNKTAISDNQKSYTYAEADILSDSLARFLTNKNLCGGIIIRLPRCAEFVIAEIGVMKSGCFFIPVDPDISQERFTQIIKTVNPCFIIDSENYGDCFSDEPAPLPEITSDMTAYVIMTSGTTGEAKGVAVSHKAISHYLTWAMRTYKTDENTATALIYGFTFDGSFGSIYNPILSGGTLYILDDETRFDIPKIADFCAEKAVTHIDLPAALLGDFTKFLADSNAENSLRYIITGGEQVKPFYDCKIPVSNEYGPTECTVAVTQSFLSSGEKITVGNAVPNTQIYILDKRKNPCPLGIFGEAYVSGIQLSNGYIGGDKSAFSENPFGAGKLYKTGDIMRFTETENGFALEFYGRNDGQIKLNGFRIEIGEIEAAACKYCGVKNAVAVFRNGFIVLYAVCENAEKVLEKLRAVLPHYMIPTVFAVPEIPLKNSGKPDIDKLTAYEKSTETATFEITHECEILCNIVFEITGKKVSGNDNFISIGGNSITAMKISFALAEQGTALSATEIISSKNFNELSGKMKTQNISVGTSYSFIPPNVLKSMIYLSQKDGEKSYTVTAERVCSVNFSEIEKRIKKAVSLHDILRCRFKIGGESGFIAEISETPNIKLLSGSESLPQFIDPLGETLVFVKLERDLLTLCYHHIVLDGYSIELLLSEIADGNFPDRTESYADFVNTLTAAETDYEYYENTLRGFEPIKLFDSQGTPEKLLKTRYFKTDFTEKIENAAKRIGITPAVFIMTALGVFLSAFANTEKTYIPVVASFRKSGGLLGCAAQTFPVAFSVSENFGQAAENVRNCLSETISHINIPEEFLKLPYIFIDDNSSNNISGSQNYSLIIKSNGDILYDKKSVSDNLLETLKTRLFAALENAVGNEISIFENGEKERISQDFSHGIALKNTVSYLKDTYSKKAVEIAEKLKNNGIGSGDIVAIEAERENSVIDIYAGVSLSGAAFLPIDCNLPESRKSEIAGDCKPAAIIKNGEVTLLQNSEKKSPDTAYIIYTSGSTGKPKGVPIGKKALESQITWSVGAFDFSEKDVFLHYINFAFDPSVWVIYSAILSGAKTEVVPENIRNLPDKIAEFISEKNITTAVLPAAAAYEIISKLRENKLRLIFIGGDRIHIPKRTAFTENIEIYNLYGPTETCINAAFYKLPKNCEKTSCIGKPIGNTDLYILDKKRRLSPVGIHGELYIGGDKLSEGYINRPNETKLSFIKTESFGRLYKTGDIAKWNADGTVEFIGREDRQVKIRGFRVELSEIEAVTETEIKAALSSAFSSAVAVTYDNGVLAAFCAADFSESQIKEKLRARLPAYMVPNRIISLEKLPVNANGKIDYNALTVPKCEADTLPLTETEKIIAGAFESVLAISPETVGRNADFYALGGHSLKLFALSGTLAAKGISLGINDILEHPVVSELAEIADKATETAAKSGILPSPETSYADFVKQSETISLDKMRKTDNIVITGATGFLGAHILRECLCKTSARITLPVRGSASRIDETLNYYFPGEVFDFSRLNILTADISDRIPGIDGDVDIIYHSAADIRHYAPFDEAYRANVTATENIIRFAKEKDAYLAHISTASAVNRPVITEDSFELGNDFENVYQRTKQTAERLLFAEKNLQYGVFRVGNVTPSIAYGKKSKSADSNAYLRLLSLLVKSRTLPDFRGRSGYCFADRTAEAICLLSERYIKDRYIFHITNPNVLTFRDIFVMIGINDNGDKENIPEELRGIYTQRAVEKHTDISSEIKNSGTVALLSRLGFLWNAPDREYMKAFIGYDELL